MGVVLPFSVSHTTRPPRDGEVSGVHYHFVSSQEFQHMVDRGDFLEWASVHGYYYGTSRTSFNTKMNEGKGVLLDIDVQGTRALKALHPETKTIFILPPNPFVLQTRLRERRSDSSEAIEVRLQNAREEIAQLDFFDYWLLNDDFNGTVRDLKGIFWLLAKEEGGVSPDYFRNKGFRDHVFRSFGIEPSKG